MLKQKIFIPVMAAVLVGGGIFGTGIVMAQSTPGQDPTSSLVQKIAQKFNLNQAEVQAVFDQHQQDRMQKMEGKVEDRLTQAVKDGKITDAQKSAILAKISETKGAHLDPQQFKNMTGEQRKQFMENKKTEIETWASQNGLSLSTLRELIGPGVGFRGKGGFGEGHFMMKSH